MRIKNKSKKRKGSFLTEFALVGPLMVLMLAGTVDVGMQITRSIQASQVVRNANVLMARGIDLSNPINQGLLIRTAEGLGMNIPGTANVDPNGKGVIWVSKVVRVGPTTCSMGMTNYNGSNCPNEGEYVIAQQVKIGNQSVFATPVGQPTSPKDSMGAISDLHIATVTSNRASGFPGIIQLELDQTTYIAELYVDTANQAFFSVFNLPMVALRNIS